jgi:hypothetical protein
MNKEINKMYQTFVAVVYLFLFLLVNSPTLTTYFPIMYKEKEIEKTGLMKKVTVKDFK